MPWRLNFQSLNTLLLIGTNAYSQQDVTFHIDKQLLAGKQILKVTRDYYDPYVWVLAQNNEVYRINSLNMAIDDYSASFSAYSNLQFIDIAGHNKDTVFVAANSPDVIEYYNGSVRDIGQAQGLTDNVNSIAMGNSGLWFDPRFLQIGTSHGLGQYDISANLLNYLLYRNYTNGPVRIFSETYRTTMFTSDNNDYISPEFYYPIVFSIPFETFAYDIRHMLQSANKITTAYYVPVGVVNPTVFAGSFFWGNSTGLYQESMDYEQGDPEDFNHFLDNVGVNKIADIFGLTSFYGAFNPYLSKDNLLVGTNKGLYFSSSLMANFVPVDIAGVNLFHFDPLGNLKINDICVNTNGKTFNDIPTSCENGVWLGTDDGVYFLDADYGAYVSKSTYASALYVNKLLTDPITNVNVCQGSSIKAQLNSRYINSNTIQWEKDGKDIAGANGTTLEIKTAGEYYAILYDLCANVHIPTNRIEVSLISSPVFSFNYPDKIPQCGPQPYTLSTDYSPDYNYRWYTNGIRNNNTTNTFTVTQTGKYKVEVSACTNTWVSSKEVEVDLINLPVPQITADKPVYCAEDVAVLTENAPVDPSYTITWYRDGTLLTADNNLTAINETTPGSYTVMLSSTIATCTQTSAPQPLAFTPVPVFTFNYPDQLQYCAGTPLTLTATGSTAYQYRWYKDGVLNGSVTPSLTVTANGTYKVEVSACAGSWVGSKEVQVALVQIPVPAIKTDKAGYCIGDNASLSLAEAADPDYTINWYKDNVLLPASTNQVSIVTNVPGLYTVALVNSTANTDGSVCSQTSTPQAISFNPLPTVSIDKIVNTTICDGQTIGLLAHYNGGTVKWSTGETTDQVSLTQPGTYSVTVTSAAGCQAQSSIDITFLPNPVFSVNDTSVCTYKKQVITLTAPPGFAQYAWNGQTGGQTYQVSTPQTVSLTVTDINGCQATQQIKVADQCPNIYIPNTFTPNGDGVNDTWVIEGLESDPSVTVKVFTRNGALVFESIGYGAPWNAEYNGKKLPAGVYYYVITAKNGTQKFSGALTIIY